MAEEVRWPWTEETSEDQEGGEKWRHRKNMLRHQLAMLVGPENAKNKKIAANR